MIVSNPAPLYLVMEFHNHNFIKGEYNYMNDFFNVKCKKCNCYAKIYCEFTTKTIYMEAKYKSLSCEECIIKNIIE